NREAANLFGAKGDAYQQTIDAASKGGLTAVSFSSFAFVPTLLVLPFLAFYLLWPNWGATLYGEVRGAKDIRKPFWSMFWGLWVIVMGLWFFGWAGTLFLSSTRVIFAAAFDRVLPAWAASISSGRRVPYGSLGLMLVPALVVSWLYAYKTSVQAFFYDATAVIAITF